MSNLSTMPDPYQFLEKISTEELRRLLREDFESTDETTPENDEFITKVMEVIARREESASSAPIFDLAAGWKDFQKNYYPTGDDPIPLCDDAQLEELTRKHRVAKSSHQSLTPSSRHRIKPFALVAATIGIFMSLLIVVQAAGLDVFGAMAQWTDEVFHFVPSAQSDTPSSKYSAAFRQALEQQALPAELAPSWFPDGFTAGEPNIFHSDLLDAVNLVFYSEDGRSFSVDVSRYYSKQTVVNIPYEKDAGPVEEYIHDNKTFYIMSNVNIVRAIWNDDNLTLEIGGDLRTDELKTILNSIGGQ